jgi:hypothetical protein
MRQMSVVSSVAVLAAAALVACGGDDNGGEVGGQATALRWYTTCGDPVCTGYRGPIPGIPLCASEKEGGVCTVAAAECDPKDACNARLRCTDKDPKQQVGGCPVSRAAFKQDVRYLDDGQRAELARELLALKLATYHYKDTGALAAPRLGFLIDDVNRSGGSLATLAVNAERDQVDLYGYVSSVVAALQVQAQQIEALRAEVKQLRDKNGRRNHIREGPDSASK